MKRRLLALLAMTVIAAVGVLAWFLASVPNPFGNDKIEDVLSPDARYRAILFHRNCGATTGYSTQASIIDASESLPNEPGNVLIADGKTLS